VHPTITIVTPSFNQGSFLEETIRSVISQSGDFFIDYVIVDGGSTDNSLEIIKKYEALLQSGTWPIPCRGIRYRWLSEKDNGQSEAINKGFRMAEGDIVAWLNSDDYYLPGACARVAGYFQNNETLAMVYGDGEVVDEVGRKKRYDVEPFFDAWKLIHLYDFILQPSVFMNHKALKKAGCLDETLHYIMDWDLWIRLSRFGEVRHVPEKLSCARVYPEAKTQSTGMKRWREIRQLAKRYGHMKWPPVVFTQLFHRPVHAIFGSPHTKGPSDDSFVMHLLKQIYYAFIGGNRSGICGDGCAERTSFLSIPLRPEFSRMTIRITPLCPNHLRYIINNSYAGALDLRRDVAVIEVVITEGMKRWDFLHIKFISDNDIGVGPLPATAAQRKCAFVIGDISLQEEDGSEVSDIGLPKFTEYRQNSHME
jgi:glycosyltransferase involved in cell wall biosynthesis